MAVDDYYQACGNLGQEFRIHGNQKVELRGCLFDRIKKQEQPAGPYLSFLGAPNQSKWISKQRTLVTELDPYPGGSDVMDVLYRTIIGDRTFNGDIADDAYKVYFIDFLRQTETSTAEQQERATNFCDSARR
jgi:hypothetical protein